MPGRVEPGGGLVEQQQLRLAQQRRGDAEPLPHAVRVPADAILGAVAQLDHLEHLLDARARVAAVEIGEQPQVLPAREVRVEPRPLDEAGDAVERSRADVERVAAEEASVSLGRPDQSEQHAQRRRLPRAVRPEVAEDVAALDRQVDVVDRDDLAVALDETARFDRLLRCSPDRRSGRLGGAARQ